ncbi:syntaxin-5 [Anaeramoeba ignava]|uniref:Syntaxin-5 n=1 Tax=Anaeramoeba ignava TaxID=1746090 RepID=A0A9Q0LVJ3_ANAIG|nr:syntaxin-5 [Anaeramoeba ignava]|eukprot:Anaeramoba_ignava/a223350_31.p1 GENE.a223350_31~~a223350_31.p1  ORF type:complete len:319 (+),score=120.32 a223350_31:12-968(+)
MIEPASFQDRTEEFFSIIENLKTQEKEIFNKKQNNNEKTQKQKKKTGFMIAASYIGKQIYSTCLKLSKLSKLAQSNSLVYDTSQEIQELTHIIKQEIQELNSKIQELQTYLNNNKPNNSQSSNHTKNIIDSLKNNLKNATKDFQNVLEQRNENLKIQQERKSRLGDDSNINMLKQQQTPIYHRPLTYEADPLNQFVLNEEQEKKSGNQEENFFEDFQTQKTIANQSTRYYQERVDAVEDIEKTINEVSSVFNQLSVIINEQDVQIDWIEKNVEDTLVNVEKGETELTKYMQSLKSNRWLIFKIFIVLIIFIIIFSLIM